MSSVQVEQPSIFDRPRRRISNIDSQTTDYASRWPTSHMSHTPVIDVDADERSHQMANGSSRTAIRQSVVSPGDDEPPANRRRTSSGTQQHPVFVVDDIHEERSTSRHSPGASNGAQHRPIVVSDSDDEQGDRVASTSYSVNARTRARLPLHRRGGGSSSDASFRIFSPSPPPQQHFPAPPIIAGPMPFAILPPAPNNNQPGPHRSRPASPLPRNGAGIQLGGGLLSQTLSRARNPPVFNLANFGNLFRSTTARSAQDDARREQRSVAYREIRDQGLAALDRLFINFYARNGLEFDGGGNDEWVDDVGGGGWGDGGGGGGWGDGGAGGPWARRDAALGLGPDYEPRMTHPGRAGPGWTFDFGAEDGGAGDGGAEILVCAQCLDPLLANAEGMVEVSEEERRDRRVWGLRCGHVLDGKCVGALMRPESDDERETASGKGKDVEEKGKGKQKELAEEQEVDVLVQPLDVKGKGKAPATVPRAPTPPPSVVLLNDSPVAPALPDNSIRARLRSRTRPDSLPKTPTVTRRGRGTKRKRGMDDAETETVDGRHEWSCPVAGCGRTHLSIKVGGAWKMDMDDGAVGIFV